MQSYLQELLDTKIIPSLSDFIRIPNLSPQFDLDWQKNGFLFQACLHLKNWIQSYQEVIPGMTVQLLQLNGVPPLIYVDIPSENKQNTVLFYGHYDKQPHFSGWSEGLSPTIPVLRNNKLYGRGGADDGYSIYTSIAVILTLINQNQKYPHCIMLFEGEEESGSHHFMQYFNLIKAKFDYIITLDTGCDQDYDRLWVTSSLRGSITMDINVQNFNQLRNILDLLEDSKTGECHHLFQSNIPQDKYQEILQTYQYISLDFNQLCDKMHDSQLELYLNRTWKPTISYIGLTQSEELILRLNIRLPPNKSAPETVEDIQQLLKLENNNTNNNNQEIIHIINAKSGLVIPFKEETLSILNEASKTHFGVEMKIFHEGGSIPFLNILAETCKEAQFIVVGVLGPNSNAHGPNEMLEIDYMKKLILVLSDFLCEIQ